MTAIVMAPGQPAGMSGYPTARRRGSGDITRKAVTGGYRGQGRKPNAVLAVFDDAGRFVEFVPVAYHPEARS